MGKSIIKENSFQFALVIIKLYRNLVTSKKEANFWKIKKK
jgi:hypothetical protein